MSYKTWAEALKARRAQKPSETEGLTADKALQGEATTPAPAKASSPKQA